MLRPELKEEKNSNKKRTIPPEKETISSFKKQHTSQKEEKTDSAEEKKEESTTKTIFQLFKQGDILLGLKNEKEEDANKLKTLGFKYPCAKFLNNPTVRHILKGEEVKSKDTMIMKHVELLKKNLAYLKRPGGKPFVEEPQDKEWSCAIRRSCKLLATERDARQIHVYTKGVDWDMVFDKEKSKDSVTGSELRVIARNEIRHGKNPNILFYAPDGTLMDKRPWELPEARPYYEPYEKHVIERDEAGLSHCMKG